MDLYLWRTYQPGGTNGQLLYAGQRLCYTIELPWQANRRRISCIPEGHYRLQPRVTNRFGRHFLVTGVPGRECILLHPANDALRELAGCIAPVRQLTGPGKGTRSREALAVLVELLWPAFAASQPVFLHVGRA